MASLFHPDEGARLRWGASFLALLGHGAALAALTLVATRLPPSASASVLAVSWVSEAPPNAAPEPTVQPKPLPASPQPPRPRRQSQPPAPSPMLAETPADAAAAHASLALPAAAPELVAAAPTPAAAEPMPVVAPRFDADYLSNPAPAYPAGSRAMGEQGKVLLRVLVTPSGEAREVLVRTSSGFERLDQSALEAVRRWKFVPARQGDEAVTAWVVVPILFSLRR